MVNRRDVLQFGMQPMPMRPMFQQGNIAPSPGGWSPRGNYNPVTQSLQGGSPDQFQALQGQLTPEMIQQANQLFQNPQFVSMLSQNPQFQQQMAQLQEMVKNGQISPEMLSQMMDGGAGMPFPGLGNQPPELNQLLKIGIVSSLMGLGLGHVVDRGMSNIQRTKGSIFEKVIKVFEELPGVSTLNQNLKNRMASAHQQLTKGIPVKDDVLMHLDTAYTPDAVTKNFFSTYLGPKGHFAKDFQKLRLPQPVLNHLTAAKSLSEVQQVLDSNILHFLPEEGRDIAKQAFSQGFFQQQVKAPVRSFLSSMAPKAVSSPKASMTLAQLDRLIDKEQLVKLLNDASQGAQPAKRLSPDMLHRILDQLERPVANLNHPADRFARNITRLLQDPRNKLAGAELKRLLGLGEDVSYTAVQAAIKVKTGGRLPVWQALQESSKGLLSKELNNPANMTLEQVNAHFKRHHVINRLRQNGSAEKLQTLLSGFLKRAKNFESSYASQLKGEYAFRQTLEKRGIGPVGRLLAKWGFYLQRIFSGANLKRFGPSAVGGSSQLFGRLIVSLGIFGFAISGFLKAPKESRVATFMDNIASGLGGYLGYEVGRHWVHELGLLTRSPGMRRFAIKKVLGVLPFTWGGVIAEFAFPMLVASGFGFLARNIVQPIFGNPDKIEKELAAKKSGQPQAPLETAKTNEKQPASKAQAAQPTDVNALLNPNPQLSAQTVGLTPEQIAMNPVAQREDATFANELKDLKGMKQSIWSFGH